MSVAAPPASRLVPLATGLRYHVLEWPADSDHTVLLLHGFLDSAWSWEAVVDAGLAGRFHVIAPDFRGHGDSDRVGAGGYYHFVDYLADLDALIPEVARGRVSLVGHSMGGNVATYFCGTYPTRIAKLALLEAVPPPAQSDTGPERVAAWIAGWRRARSTKSEGYATVDEAAARLRERDPRTEPALARRIAELTTREGPDGRRRFKHDPAHLSTGPFRITPEIAQRFRERITCPTLIVAAADSEYGPPDAPHRPNVAGARHAVVENAGHMLMRHQPRRVAELLVDFLSERASLGSSTSGPAEERQG